MNKVGSGCGSRERYLNSSTATRKTEQQLRPNRGGTLFEPVSVLPTVSSVECQPRKEKQKKTANRQPKHHGGIQGC